MTKKLLCPECDQIVPVRIENRLETTNVKGIPVTAYFPVSMCPLCSAEFVTADQMDEGLSTAYKVYREMTGVISPEKIIQLRNKYNASQKAFGIILGFGELTINTYEKGSIPSEAHQKVLESAEDAEWFCKQFEKAKPKLGQTQIKRIEQAISGLTDSTITVASNNVYSLSNDLSCMVGEEETEYTGWVKPEIEKLFAMMVYILSHTENVYKMKLLKILFYADFYHYQETSHSISGWAYARLPYGPVPQDFETVLFEARRSGILCSEPDKEQMGEIFSIASDNTSILLHQLSDEEKASLETVCNKLGQLTASQLSNLTHEEDGWLTTAHAECISYAHALTLKGING